MGAAPGTTPAEDLAAFLVSFAEEMTFSDEAPAAIVDRCFAPGFVQYNDGIPIDRENLIAHARPVRRNVVSCRTEVHEALVVGDKAAARYTLYAVMRKGNSVDTEVYMFGQLAQDGRLTRIDQITRAVSADDAAE